MMITGAASAMLGVSFAIEIISRLTHLPISGIMLYIGATLLPPYATSFFLGSIFGRIIQSRMGEEPW